MNIDEYIDRIELNERLDGDFELFRDLTGIFIDDSENLLSEIKKAIDSLEPERVRKSAHTLKGAVANFSAKKAYESALTLEKIGKSGDLSGAAEAFVEVKQYTVATVAALKELAEKNSLV